MPHWTHQVDHAVYGRDASIPPKYFVDRPTTIAKRITGLVDNMVVTKATDFLAALFKGRRLRADIKV